jgi:hypothetical protein
MTASSIAMISRARITNRLQDGLTSSWMDLLASVLSIIAALSLIYIVRAIDRRQDEKSWWMAGIVGSALGAHASRIERVPSSHRATASSSSAPAPRPTSPNPNHSRSREPEGRV